MKKSIVLKSLGVICLVLLLVGLLRAVLLLQVETILQETTIYIASHDIEPRTRIQESDLLEVKLPENYLPSGIALKKEDILNKYTEIQGKIPAGSYFYESMLFNESQLPEYPDTLLRQGQSAFTMQSDITLAGGALTEGQRVDIYASITSQQSLNVTGCLIKNARVIAIKDHKGLSLDDPESTGMMNLVILAVNSDDLSILTSVSHMGELRLFVSDASYNSKQEAILQNDCPVLELLNTETSPS